MKDLTNIPEKYHILFTSDWNKGNESTMKPLQRVEMNELQLSFNRYELNLLMKDKLKEEETIVGFVKD